MDKEKINAVIDAMKKGGLYVPPIAETLKFGDKDLVTDIFKHAFQAHISTDYIHLPIYDEVIDWMTDNKGKGLFLVGNFGVGKSVIVRSVIPYAFMRTFNKTIKTYNPRQLSSISREDYDIILSRTIISLDDIGREYVRNDYGNKFDPVVYAIEEAYDNRKLLLLTTNLTKDEILKRYGEHIFDRVKEVCNIVTIKHKSLR